MNDAEKVREALQAAYTPLADVDETVQTQVFDALDFLDSILTELAEARAARRDANGKRMAAEERAKKAEASRDDWMRQASVREGLLTQTEARIQELEAENDRLRQGLVEALEEQS